MLGWRVRTPYGEVDVVAERGGVLLCAEVKAGRQRTRTPVWRPGERFRWRAQARQRRSSQHLARQLGRGFTPRVALFEVLLPERGPWWRRSPIVLAAGELLEARDWRRPAR